MKMIKFRDITEQPTSGLYDVTFLGVSDTYRKKSIGTIGS
jgi:hypothetical protein